MTRAITVLPEKDPRESVVVEFPFAGELSAPASPTLTITAINGSDPAIANMLEGAAQISGTSVLQRVNAGVDDISYKLRCEASQGSDIRVRTAVLPVKTA